MDVQTIIIISVLFTAALIASTFGFGVGLITMPILAMMVEIKTAASLSVAVALTVVFTVLLKHWRDIQFKSVLYLIISSCAGVPLGLWLLYYVQESVLKFYLALIIVAFACYSLLSNHRMMLRTDRSAWVFGGVCGILGAAYTLPGPPVIVYGILRRWPPEHFRVTLLGFFLPHSLLVIIGYYFSGYLTPRVMHLYAYSLPALLIAVVIGNRVNRTISKEKFVWFVHVLLILLGILLLFQVIRATFFPS